MKLITKTLIITSLSLAVISQVSAGGRHDPSVSPKSQENQYQVRQVGWDSHRDDRRSHREKRIYRERHQYSNNRPWRQPLHDRYHPRKHYWKHYDRPSHRYYYDRPGHRYDYGRSSGTLIFRW